MPQLRGLVAHQLRGGLHEVENQGKFFVVVARGQQFGTGLTQRNEGCRHLLKLVWICRYFSHSYLIRDDLHHYLTAIRWVFDPFHQPKFLEPVNHARDCASGQADRFAEFACGDGSSLEQQSGAFEVGGVKADFAGAA